VQTGQDPFTRGTGNEWEKKRVSGASSTYQSGSKKKKHWRGRRKEI